MEPVLVIAAVVDAVREERAVRPIVVALVAVLRYDPAQVPSCITMKSPSTVVESNTTGVTKPMIPEVG
jgi:hypothetical protein